MDPYIMSMVITAAQQHPEQFAQILAQTGTQPPDLSRWSSNGVAGPSAQAMQPQAMPAAMPAAAPEPMRATEMAQASPGIGAWDTQVTPAGPAGQPSLGGLMQGLQLAGKSAPGSADQKPIMSGGISSAQRAPEPQKQSGGSSAQSMDMILKLLMGGGQNPLRVPALGQMMRG